MNQSLDSPVVAAPSAASLAMLDRLIEFPTVSRDSNLGLIEWVRDDLANLGVRSFLTYDHSGKKANLFATLAADQARAKTGGVVLSGHTDTVPVDGQAWDSDPFIARHADRRIYGRGSADMKGFIAVALAMAPRFLAAQERVALHLALSYDEEVGCLGVHSLLADLEERGVRPTACIVGEPTDMRAVVAHKGKRDFCCRVRGREAHSSLAPRAVNAIETAADIIAFIRALGERLQQHETRDERFDIPFTTLQTGTVRGGIATNVVPRDCEFTFEMRNLPATSSQALFEEIARFAQQLQPRMQRIAADAGVEFEHLAELPAFAVAPDAAVVRWAQMLAGTGHLGTGSVGFGTEASLFARARIPTVLLGPGSIEQAHKPNEYISYAQIAACERFFERLIETPLPEGERGDSAGPLVHP